MSFASASTFRRSGPRDERRRRLLLDEHASCPSLTLNSPVAEGATEGTAPSHYGDGEFLQHQLRFVDLVPRRWAVLIGVLAGVVLTATGLGGLHCWADHWHESGRAAITGLDVNRTGSFASWFLSLVLLSCSVVALAIHGVRRNRLDDYQGRYRIWGWAAICWFAMATDQITGLHDTYRQAAVSLTGMKVYGDGSLWFVLSCLLILGMVGSRLILDMRPNTFSIVALSLAAVAQAITLVAILQFDIGFMQEPLFRFGCETWGSVMLLAAMLAHARHVLMDAEGLLPEAITVNESKSVADEKTETGAIAAAKTVATKVQVVDEAHLAPPANHSPAMPDQKPSCLVSASVPSKTLAASDAAGDQKLTKAERKALKDRLFRQRLERERGKR